MMCRIESQKAMKCVLFAINVYENSGLSSTTNPKSKGQPSISLPSQANLTQQKAEPLRCLALRTRGGRLKSSCPTGTLPTHQSMHM